MRSVERLVMSWSRITCLLFGLCACNTSHTQGSTETGNPPVIDVDKIALVVSSDGVKVVGAAGAVTPGGATVELAILGTDEVARGPSKPDGSFEIALDTTEQAVVEVSASDAGKRSGTVYVTRGGATVGTGQDAELSCMQRSNLASQAIGSALLRATGSCETAADCRLVSNKTVCTDSCGDALVSSAEVAAIEAAVNAIDDGLCASFAADGCNVIAQPCTPPLTGAIECVSGRCAISERPGVTCPSCLNREVSWGPSSHFVTNTISSCATFSRTTMGQTPCAATVPHCGAGADATVEDLIQALSHPDVVTALSDQGVFGGPPAPGGMSRLIEVDGASFVIAGCGDPSCSDLPAGVKQLNDLLDRIADELVCQ